ncbi:hypothetical protein ACH5RR_007716 [Cinchona calisaya]|uniref:EF-hand domain-containing protein n=1 Tax=Cinchona calisaya TaxID=153742 RepID=A0ABD3AAZ8_9GENT
MEKIYSIPIIGFILQVIEAENPISFVLFTLLRKIINWIHTLQGKRKNVNGGVDSFLKPCINEAVFNKEKLIKGDVQIVMEKLGISWDSNGNELQERLLGLGEISTLFDEIEPSLEEVKEAFDIFDDNKDGYIDAKDLEKILCALGYVEISQLECQRMIMAFSTNGEKRIDFRNFVKITEDSFC